MRFNRQAFARPTFALLVGLCVQVNAQASAQAAPARVPATAARSPDRAALDTERPPASGETTDSNWYGWQTLAVDGASLALLPVGVGAIGVIVGAPLVHLAHGRVAIAGASAAIRGVGIVLPVVLYARECFAFSLDWGDSDDSGSDAFGVCEFGLPVWMVGGLLGAIAIDAALLSHEPAPRASSAGLRVLPWADRSGDAGLALSGRF